MDLVKEIELVKKRNERVEQEKAWETSWTRRISIAAGTYIIAGFWLVVIRDSYPWLKAFVPAGGYLLSTLSLPFIKNWWISRRKTV